MYRDRWARHLLESLVIVFVMLPALHFGARAQSSPDMKMLIDKLIESGRGTQVSGHGVDRTWQMWLEEASRATSDPAR
jgi:hypothetical protein